MHRHSYSGRKLGREAGPRKALLRNLVSQVILHEKIKTTLPKAKEVQPILEKLITKAKVDSVTSRRMVGKFLSNNDKSLEKLFVELGPLYKERNGGYTRIIKLPNRVGDNAPMAQIQLLDTENLTKKEIEKEKKAKPESKKAKTDKEPVKKTAPKAKPAVKKVKAEAK